MVTPRWAVYAGAGGPDLVRWRRPVRARPRCPVTAARGSAPRSPGRSSPRCAFSRS